jgi:hypothetical protein
LEACDVFEEVLMVQGQPLISARPTGVLLRNGPDIQEERGF